MHQYPKLIFVIKPYMFRPSSLPLRQGLSRLELRSNLTLLGSGHIPCMKRTNCRVYSV